MSPIPARAIEALRLRYAEPHRSYHGQSHIDAMLRVLHAGGMGLTDPDAVELAIWYHDAIYDPAAADNEARSADLLLAEMAGFQSPASLRTAELMVRATADHIVPADLPGLVAGDVAAFLDLDMAVLGAEPAEYDAYEAGIAAEYVPVHGAEAYRSGRTAFLRSMLARERLFLTDACHVALDGQARTNMRRALAASTAGEGGRRQASAPGPGGTSATIGDDDGSPTAVTGLDEVSRINQGTAASRNRTSGRAP